MTLKMEVSIILNKYIDLFLISDFTIVNIIIFIEFGINQFVIRRSFIIYLFLISCCFLYFVLFFEWYLIQISFFKNSSICWSNAAYTCHSLDFDFLTSFVIVICSSISSFLSSGPYPRSHINFCYVCYSMASNFP